MALELDQLEVGRVHSDDFIRAQLMERNQNEAAKFKLARGKRKD